TRRCMRIGFCVAAVVLTFAAPAAAQSTGDVETRDLCGPVGPGFRRCMAKVVVTSNATPPRGLLPLAPKGLGPAALQSPYNLPASGGGGRVVAIVDAHDAPNAEADMNTYRAQYGIPECTTANGCFKKVNQKGRSSPLPSPDSGWAGEIALDLDMV